MLGYKIRKLLFHNIGGKIKTLAMVLAIIGAGISLISGLNMMVVGAGRYYGGGSIEIMGFLIIIVGTLWSWISSFLLYGFGELIDRVCGIHEMIDWKLQQEFVQEQSEE